MKNKTVLTERQIEVLKLRKDGLSQEEIAERFKTTKQNISSIERTAWKKIERAENTIKFVKMLKAPAWIEIKEDTSIDSIVGRIYAKADERKIRVIYDGVSLATKIREDAKGKIRHRTALAKLEIGITGEGDVIVL